MKYEFETPDIRQCDLSSVSDDYTAFLGDRIFTLSSQRQSIRQTYPLLSTNSSLGNDDTRITQSNGSYRGPKEASQLQSPPLPNQIGRISAPAVINPASRLSDNLLKSENSPIQDLPVAYDAPELVMPSINGSRSMPPAVLQQEEPNGSWMNAFDSMGSGGNVYSPVKDLLGGIGPHMDDINEFSDIWDWF